MGEKNVHGRTARSDPFMSGAEGRKRKAESLGGEGIDEMSSGVTLVEVMSLRLLQIVSAQDAFSTSNHLRGL